MTPGSVEHLNTSTLLAEAECTAEHAKATLARELHDDLGGLLVAALMDTDWVEQHLELAPALRSRLGRIKEVLSQAIDKQRRILEELRPSLLDTMGLFAAVRWQHRKTCQNADLVCSASYPDTEPHLTQSATTALFRIIQGALIAATRQPSATSLYLGIEALDGVLSIDIRHDGDTLAPNQQQNADVVTFWLLEHRVRALGGNVSITSPKAGGMHVTAEIPLDSIVLR